MSINKYIYEPQLYSIECSLCGNVQDLGDKLSKIDLESDGWRENEAQDGAICPRCNGVEASASNDSNEAIENNENDCQLLVDTLDNLYALALSLHLQQVTLEHNLAKCDICQSLAGTNTLLVSYDKGHS